MRSDLCDPVTQSHVQEPCILTGHLVFISSGHETESYHMHSLNKCELSRSKNVLAIRRCIFCFDRQSQVIFDSLKYKIQETEG